MKKKITIILFIIILLGLIVFLIWGLSQILIPIKPDVLSFDSKLAILLVSNHTFMLISILVAIKFWNIKLLPLKIKWPSYNEMLYLSLIAICLSFISTSFHFFYSFSKEHLVFIKLTLPELKSLYNYCYILGSIFSGPIIEEILYRKIIFTKLKEYFPLWISFLVNSILFSFMHLDFNNFILFILVGLVFTYIYNSTKSIVLTIFCHSLSNTFVIFTRYTKTDYSINTLFLYIIIFLGAYFGLYYGLKRLKKLSSIQKTDKR